VGIDPFLKLSLPGVDELLGLLEIERLGRNIDEGGPDGPVAEESSVYCRTGLFFARRNTTWPQDF
jgi:hypothetical protein